MPQPHVLHHNPLSPAPEESRRLCPHTRGSARGPHSCPSGPRRTESPLCTPDRPPPDGHPHHGKPRKTPVNAAINYVRRLGSPYFKMLVLSNNLWTQHTPAQPTGALPRDWQAESGIHMDAPRPKQQTALERGLEAHTPEPRGADPRRAHTAKQAGQHSTHTRPPRGPASKEKASNRA